MALPFEVISVKLPTALRTVQYRSLSLVLLFYLFIRYFSN
jgi:hypothetical protein